MKIVKTFAVYFSVVVSFLLFLIGAYLIGYHITVLPAVALMIGSFGYLLLVMGANYEC